MFMAALTKMAKNYATAKRVQCQFVVRVGWG